MVTNCRHTIKLLHRFSITLTQERQMIPPITGHQMPTMIQQSTKNVLITKVIVLNKLRDYFQ